MKKKDILSLLEYKIHVYNSSYGKVREYGKTVDELENPLKCIKDIEEIKDEVNILEQGFNELRNKRSFSERYVKEHKEEVKRIRCTHPIVHGELGWGRCYWCALCGEQVQEEKNRVRLMREDYNDDSDYRSYPCKLSGFMERKQEHDRLYTLINNLMKDFGPEDEIDLNSLFNSNFESYDIGTVEVDEPEEIKYKILLLSGSNTIKLEDNMCIKREEKFDDHLLKYLLDIDCFEIYNVTSFNGKFYEHHSSYYATTEDLKNELNKLLDIDFTMIIDMSKLVDYKITDDKTLIFELQDTPSLLKTMFPGSMIYQIKTKKDEIELLEELKNLFLKSKVKKIQRSYHEI